MFTGLVQAVGLIAQSSPSNRGLRVVVDAKGWDHRPAPGDSICVSGVCLTVAGEAASVGRHGPHELLAFDVVPETLAKTTAGRWAPGMAVNLEHAARADTLLGGHIVQGHVDGVGTVERVQTQGEWRVTIRPPEDLRAFLAPKGSICVEGVSLTLAEVSPAQAATFDVALIPTTLERTTLGALKAGDAVNLEADIIAKTVVNYLRNFLGTQYGAASTSAGRS